MMATHIELGLTPEEMADKNPATLRDMERLESDEWVPTRIKELKQDHVFRYKDAPEVKYRAICMPYVNAFYVWTIDTALLKRT